jgi:hypothetical protein
MLGISRSAQPAGEPRSLQSVRICGSSQLSVVIAHAVASSLCREAGLGPHDRGVLCHRSKEVPGA